MGLLLTMLIILVCCLLMLRSMEVEAIRKILSMDIFPFFCRFIALFLIFLALYSIGFPPKVTLNTTAITLLSFSVLFCFSNLLKS